MMPTSASQPGPTPSSFMTYQSSESTFLTAVLTYWEELNDHTVITLSSLTFQTWPPR